MQLRAITETRVDQVQNSARGALGAGSVAEQLQEEELVEQLGGIVTISHVEIGLVIQDLDKGQSLLERFLSLGELGPGGGLTADDGNHRASAVEVAGSLLIKYG